MQLHRLTHGSALNACSSPEKNNKGETKTHWFHRWNSERILV